MKLPQVIVKQKGKRPWLIVTPRYHNSIKLMLRHEFETTANQRHFGRSFESASGWFVVFYLGDWVVVDWGYVVPGVGRFVGKVAAKLKIGKGIIGAELPSWSRADPIDLPTDYARELLISHPNVGITVSSLHAKQTKNC
jgi:hypothetical protein